jgi:hypothetical protein
VGGRNGSSEKAKGQKRRHGGRSALWMEQSAWEMWLLRRRVYT